jgi:hypothetical protein
MHKVKALPSQSYLLECFDYNKETGSLIWKHRPQSHFTTTNQYKNINGRYPGKEAGSIYKSNRIMIWISGERFYKSRIIWKLVTGNDPINEIDHKDTDTLNDVFSNLREADGHQNACNRNKRTDNTSGYKGVYLRKESGRYRSIIMIKGKSIKLGTFCTKNEAYKAYVDANIKLHKDFSRI